MEFDLKFHDISKEDCEGLANESDALWHTIESLEKSNGLSQETLQTDVNSIQDPDVREAIDFMDKSLASLEDAEKVHQEIMDFEITV